MASLHDLDVRRADMRERIMKSIEQNRAALRRLYDSEAADFTPFMTHDREARALYVYLVRPEELRAVHTTTAVADSVMFDWDASGRLVGIEVLLPRESGTDAQVRSAGSDGPVPEGSSDPQVHGEGDRSGPREGHV